MCHIVVIMVKFNDPDQYLKDYKICIIKIVKILLKFCANL